MKKEGIQTRKRKPKNTNTAAHHHPSHVPTITNGRQFMRFGKQFYIILMELNEMLYKVQNI